MKYIVDIPVTGVVSIVVEAASRLEAVKEGLETAEFIVSPGNDKTEIGRFLKTKRIIANDIRSVVLAAVEADLVD